MLRKMMLAGLMGATLMSGIAPVYAQDNPDRRGDRPGRIEGGGGMMRGERMNQPRGDAPGQRWQQPSPERPAPPIARNQPDARPDIRPDARPDARPDPQWRGDRGQPGGPAQRDWRQDRQDDRQRDRDNRGDWRQDQRDGRPDWRSDRRGDPRDGRNDRRWDDNRGWNGNAGAGANWNGGRRFDDRTRWANQRRWDNGWRQDRRYDWNNYRNRYGDRYRIGRYYAPRGWDYGYRRFSIGVFLNSMLYADNYWLDDPYSYRLPPAYGTLRWVRYYDDALLVDIRDGYVVDVINDFFW